MKPRFSLRTLFGVMTLIAALFGWRQYRHSHATKFAELLTTGEYRQAEHLTVNPQESPIINYVGQNSETIMQAHVESSGSWREWWLPSVIADLRWSRGISGGEATIVFSQRWGGFAGPDAISFQTSPYIYDPIPTEAVR